MRPAFGVLGVLAGVALAAGPALAQDPPAPTPAPAPAAPLRSPTITNLSASFHVGPYTSLAIHPLDPNRVAVGTADGHVSWTEDGGATTDEAQVISPRKMDPVSIRGGSKAEFSQRANVEIDPVLQKSLSRVPRGRQDERSLLTFLALLGQGLGAARLQAWMSLNDPITDIGDIAFPRGDGPMLVASQVGVMLSDASRWSWLRTLGGPGVMPREGDLIALAVAIDPNDPHRMLASTDRGVMVSDNGGYTWAPHPDSDLEEAWVIRIVWDAQNPQLVFAVTPDSILLSQDGGVSFEPSFAAEGDIKDLALSPEAAVVATSEGIQIATSEGIHTLLDDKDLIGAIPWRDGTYLAATSEELYHVAADGQYELILRTSPGDPYLKLAGDATAAWLLSAHTVLRIGDPIDRGGRLVAARPQMLISMIAIEDAVIEATGLGEPADTRFHDRWYAKLLPRVTATMRGNIETSKNDRRDDTVLPFKVWQAGASASDLTSLEVFAMWDLREVMLGDNNVSNPNLILESQLRDKRQTILDNVRWRYRECAALVHDLQRPPADPLVELAWRQRLEEYASYLEFMSRRRVVERTAIEKLEYRE